MLRDQVLNISQRCCAIVVESGKKKGRGAFQDGPQILIEQEQNK